MTNAKSKTQKTKQLLCITAKTDGFRRCGVGHPGTETQYDFAAEDFPFSDDDIEILMAESMLVVMIKDVPVEEAPAADK